jgi:enamine deaminase RidA (YjgF/YER057c/UK114 family)
MSDRPRVSSGSPYEPVIGFSRAIRVGNRIEVSGTAPVWPDGSCDPDPRIQARRCLDIIVAAIEQLGGQVGDVVRTRVYLTRPKDWQEVGAAHGELFSEVRPASTMVVVAALLDARWKVEIEATAVVGDASG